MNVEVGDLVFLVLHGDGAEVSVTGWAVETLEGDIVVGTDPGAVSDFENKLEGKAGDQTVAFVRVPQGAASTSKPPAWAGPRTSSIPNFGACKGAWRKVTHSELASSEAEAPESKPKPKAPKTRLSQDLKGLQRPFAEDSDDEEEDRDIEEPAKFLPPGRSSMPKPVKQKGTKSSSPDLQQLVMKSLAEGGDAKDAGLVQYPDLAVDPRQYPPDQLGWVASERLSEKQSCFWNSLPQPGPQRLTPAVGKETDPRNNQPLPFALDGNQQVRFAIVEKSHSHCIPIARALQPLLPSRSAANCRSC